MRIVRQHSSKGMTCLLAALLVFLPGPGLIQAAPATSSTSSGSLSVETDPAGAAVLLDGQAQGTTPLTLQALPPGDHRVRVVKEGYLDNSRIVKVNAGRTEAVRVRLTPAAATTQVEQAPAEKKKGGGKKWLFIGLGAAAAAGTAAVLLMGGNDPPVAGTISVSPTGTGMVGLTSYTFTAQGSSDPDGDPLTYEWALGDGATASGQSTTHVYSSAGTFSVQLTVKDKEHSVTAPGASVTVNRNMAGGWSGSLIYAGTSIPLSANLSQTGSTLGGNMTMATLGGPVSGSISGNGVCPCSVAIEFKPPGYVAANFSGSLDASGNRLSGTVTGSGFTGQSWSLSR